MFKRVVDDERLDLDHLKIRAGKRLLRSRPALRLARALLPRRKTLKPHQRVELDFVLELGERLYADRRCGRSPDRATPVVWCNVFVPCELIWGLGLLPFYPETAAAIGAGLGLSPLGVEQGQALGYPVDLCTFHRSAADLRAAGLYPRADLYVATSNLCDVTGQMLANFAHTAGTPFYFLDVPQSEACPEHTRRACPGPSRRAETAVAYLTLQLQEMVDRLTATLGIPYEPARMRQAIRLSNQARTLALEVAALRETNPAPLRGSAMLDQLGMLTSMFGHPAGVAYYRALRDYTLERVRRGEPEQANQRVRLYRMHLRCRVRRPTGDGDLLLRPGHRLPLPPGADGDRHRWAGLEGGGRRPGRQTAGICHERQMCRRHGTLSGGDGPRAATGIGGPGTLRPARAAAGGHL